MTTRTIEPTVLAQNQPVSWTKRYSDYSPVFYTLQYLFRGPGDGLDVDATTDGEDFAATISAAESGALAVGRWKWQAWLTEIADTDNIFVVGEGFLKIEQGFVAGTTDAIDLRSNAQKMLDAIDAALMAFNSSDVQEYEVSFPSGKRRVQRSDKEQLLGQRKYWAAIVTSEYAREDAKNGKPLMKSIQMRVYDGK